MKSFFGNVQKLYNLFSGSHARWKVLQEAAQLSLHRMSDTCWSARIDAVRPLVKRPREIVQRPWMNCKKTVTCHLTFAMTSALWLHGCNLLSLFYWPISGSKHYKPSMIQVIPFSALKLHLMTSQS